MERRPLDQVKGVGQPVVGDLPFAGEAGDNRAGFREFRQSFEDVGIQHAIDRPGGRGGRIEVRRLQLQGDGEIGLLGLRKRGSTGQQRGEDKAFHAVSHGASTLLMEFSP